MLKLINSQVTAGIQSTQGQDMVQHQQVTAAFSALEIHSSTAVQVTGYTPFFPLALKHFTNFVS
jgi:hypothetical protein